MIRKTRKEELEEFRDLNNKINRQVVMNYKINQDSENRVQSGVLDTKIASEGKTDIDTIVGIAKNLSYSLTILLRDKEILFNMLSVKNIEPYKKFMNSLNIAKPFGLWNNICDNLIGKRTNTTTIHELMKPLNNNFSYFEVLCDKLAIFINILIICLEIQDTSNETIDDIYYGDDEAYLQNYFYDRYKFITNDYSRDDIDGLRKLYDLVISSKLDSFDKQSFLALSFYELVKDKIQKVELKSITNEDLSVEILENINKFANDSNIADKIKKHIAEEFKETDIPELMPYFDKGKDELIKKMRDLQEMELGVGLPVGGILPDEETDLDTDEEPDAEPDEAPIPRMDLERFAEALPRGVVRDNLEDFIAYQPPVIQRFNFDEFVEGQPNFRPYADFFDELERGQVFEALEGKEPEGVLGEEKEAEPEPQPQPQRGNIPDFGAVADARGEPNPFDMFDEPQRQPLFEAPQMIFNDFDPFGLQQPQAVAPPQARDEMRQPFEPPIQWYEPQPIRMDEFLARPAPRAEPEPERRGLRGFLNALGAKTKPKGKGRYGGSKGLTMKQKEQIMKKLMKGSGKGKPKPRKTHKNLDEMKDIRQKDKMNYEDNENNLFCD